MAPAYEPDYEVISEFGDLIWTGVGYGTHGVMLGLELFLAIFLLVTGAVCLARPQLDSPLMRRLGAIELGSDNARGSGFLRMVLGAQLLLPVALEAP